MTLEITQVVPEGRPMIQSYGEMRFRVSGEIITGSILVFPDHTQAWPISGISEIGMVSLEPVTRASVGLDMLLIGCGPVFEAPPKGLRAQLKDAGLVLEWMDTGAACRTFNILQSESRLAAAALIAVP